MKKPSDEQIQEAFARATNPRPEPGSWLFYGYSDAPPVICGSGCGHFHWFSSSKAMVKFVEDYYAWYHPAPSNMEPHEIAAEVQRIVSAARREKVDGEALRNRLNEFMRNVWKIEWWGTFVELCSGDSEFARSCRSMFRDDDGNAAAEAIRETERAGFVEWMASYGI